MSNSKFIQVNQNALIEIIFDQNNQKNFDYTIYKNNKTNRKSFAINENNEVNKIGQQLFTIDSTYNKFGIVDFDKYNFLTRNDYSNNSYSEYTEVKIWFPINYNFSDSLGFYLNIFTLDFDNKVMVDLSNYYLDKTNNNMFNQIELSSQPFRMNNKFWGKYVTLYIPSIAYESQQRLNNQAKIGSINYNLTGPIGLSITSPIYFDFRFLYNKSNVLNEITYTLTSQLLFSTPQTIQEENLSVNIKHANDGDYFIIEGLYNNSKAELEKYMEMRSMSGNQSYLIYTITVYEDNLPQSSRDIAVFENYSIGINDYRPVIKYTNTVASIKVDLKLVSNVNSDMIIKSAEYFLTGNELAKYGKYISSINIEGAIKPKIYNSAPTKVNLPTQDVINSFFKRKASKKVELRYVPYPVLYNMSNISIKNISEDSSIIANGQLEIILKPFDNIFKFNIMDMKNNNAYEEYSIPVDNTLVQMVFKNDTTIVNIPLYIESNEVNLQKGVVIFKIDNSDLTNIKKISTSSKKWYITLTTNGVETSIYNGTFMFEDEIVKPTSTADKPTRTVDKNTNMFTGITLSTTNKPNFNLYNNNFVLESVALSNNNTIKNITKNKFNL